MTEFTQRSERRHPIVRRITVILGGVAVILALVLVARTIGLIGGGARAQTAQEGGAGEGGPPAGGMPPMPVDVDTARRTSVIATVRATGRIEAVQAVDLRPDEQGRVVELLFREGQTVDSGTPLLRIDDALLRAQADRAAAEADLAHQQLERVRRLRAENAAAAADVERAEAGSRAAEASLSVLRLQIERSIVRAPFAGVVGQRFVSVGDYVTSANRLLALHTTDPQRAVIEVPERYAGDLRLGQTVEFTVAAQGDRVFRAQVEFIDPVVQLASRTIVVKARAANPHRLLKAGMFIEARLATATRAGAVVVPEDAVQPLRTSNVVWAVVDGKASRRQVQLGIRSTGMVEILSGVEPGVLVVVGGLERMNEGMPLAPRPRGTAGQGAGAAGAGAGAAPGDSVRR